MQGAKPEASTTSRSGSGGGTESAPSLPSWASFSEAWQASSLSPQACFSSFSAPTSCLSLRRASLPKLGPGAPLECHRQERPHIIRHASPLARVLWRHSFSKSLRQLPVDGVGNPWLAGRRSRS